MISTTRLSVLSLLACLAASAADLPRKTLLILNKEDATLSVVDAETRRLVGTAPTGFQPHEVTVSTDGKFAFASNYGNLEQPGNSISMIDLATRKEQRIVLSSLGRPHGIFYHGGKVYFSAEGSKAIGRLDPATKQVDWILGTGQNATHMVLVTADGSRMITSDIGSNTITVIDRTPNGRDWTETHIPVGKGPEALDLSPDGKQLWTAHSGDGQVSIIDLATTKVVETFNVGTKRSNRLKFTPDGKRVLISDLAAGELVFVDVTTRKELKRLPLGKGVEGILIPPDGSVAYVAVNGDNFVAIVDWKTLTVTGRIDAGKGPDGMAWFQR